MSILSTVISNLILVQKRSFLYTCTLLAFHFNNQDFVRYFGSRLICFLAPPIEASESVLYMFSGADSQMFTSNWSSDLFFFILHDIFQWTETLETLNLCQALGTQWRVGWIVSSLIAIVAPWEKADFKYKCYTNDKMTRVFVSAYGRGNPI